MTQRSDDAGGLPVDVSSDDELLAAVRAGDAGAYSALYRRHHGAALALARRLGGPHDPQDVTQEAFMTILRTVLRGDGPRHGFAAYLMRTVRNEIIDGARRAREIAVEDVELVDPDESTVSDGVDERMDRDLVTAAFRALPEPWQQILWLTEVEGLTPRAVAPQLQQSPNAVAQLSHRAREGLRTAWLQAHVDVASARSDCRWTAGALGAYERGRLSAARSTRVEGHLAGCPRCRAALNELQEISSRMRGALLPVVLGSPLLLGALSDVLAATGPVVALAVPGASAAASMAALTGGAEVVAQTASEQLPVGGAAAAADGVAHAADVGGRLAEWKAAAAVHGWTVAAAGSAAAVVAAGIVIAAQLPAQDPHPAAGGQETSRVQAAEGPTAEDPSETASPVDLPSTSPTQSPEADDELTPTEERPAGAPVDESTSTPEAQTEQPAGPLDEAVPTGPPDAEPLGAEAPAEGTEESTTDQPHDDRGGGTSMDPADKGPADEESLEGETPPKQAEAEPLEGQARTSEPEAEPLDGVESTEDPESELQKAEAPARDAESAPAPPSRPEVDQPRKPFPPQDKQTETTPPPEPTPGSEQPEPMQAPETAEPEPEVEAESDEPVPGEDAGETDPTEDAGEPGPTEDPGQSGPTDDPGQPDPTDGPGEPGPTDETEEQEPLEHLPWVPMIRISTLADT